MTEEKYPGIFLRVKAMVIDSIVIIVFMFLITYLFSLFEYVPDVIRIIAFVFLFILYDPVFTSSFGGTIGHKVVGIKVKRETNENKNIPIHFAIVRYIIKYFLGIISLLTVSGNPKSKAIHDYVVGSIVLFDRNEEIKMK